MKQLLFIKKYLSLLLIGIVLFLSFDYDTVRASVTDDSYSYKEIYDSSGKVVLTITMTNGSITIVAKSHTATNKIKWETKGLTISKTPLAPDTYDYAATEGTYHLDGWQNVNTVYNGGYGELWFSAGDKDDVINKATGITTTTIRFSADQVEKALGEDFEDITQGTPIYLHAIFDVYTEDSNGNHIIHSGQDNIKNWKQILLAEYWDRSDNQLEDFAKFFNMQIDFQPKSKYDNTLFYYTEDNDLIGSKALNSAAIGDPVLWTNEDTIKNFQSKNYELYKYVVKRKNGGSVIKEHHIGDDDKCDVSDIKSGSVKEKMGGLDVCLYYKASSVSANIVFNAVDRSNNFLMKLSDDKISPNQKYPQPLDKLYPSLSLNGFNYNRSVDYYFTYQTEAGKKLTQNGVLGTTTTPVTIQVPSDIKAGSTLTVNIYYDTLDDTDIPITILAVDKDTGKTLSNIGTDKVKSGAVYQNSTAIKDTILSNTYTYTGDWDWSYTLTTSNSIVKAISSGTTIKFTAPLATKVKSGITVKVYYNKNDTTTSDITLRVIMVGSTGKLIKELSSETVNPGSSVSKITTSTKSVDGVNYKYLDKWDYDYKTSSGTTTKNGTGLTASFTIPSTTTLGSTVTLRFYYEGSESIDVPDAAAPISVSLDGAFPYGVINGDPYGSPYFTSKVGISTTESQYVYVKTKDYLLGYTLVNRTGTVTFSVPVTMTYTLEYQSATPDTAGGAKTVTESVDDTQMVPIKRAYSYWEITKLEYYAPSSAKVYNYSLPDGSVTLSANGAYMNVPSLVTQHSSNLTDHVIPPAQVTTGIKVTAAKKITSDDSVRPDVPYEDLSSYALAQTEEATVKNDLLVFGGSTVLSNATVKKITSSPNTAPLVQCTSVIGDKALFTQNKVIDAEKINGNYTSNGIVNYSLNPASVNAYSSTKMFEVAVNDVKIHTPVICDPIIKADNEKWSQLINPDKEAFQIVLDPDTSLNDFTVKISNTLLHSNRLGYYTRDFSRSFIDPDNISYIAKMSGIVRNEMKFPFDVYIDTLNDGKKSNDQFIKSGTWIILGRSTERFYVPLWVNEGVYTAQFRTIAVNGTDKLDKTEETRNSSITNYIATDTKKFEVSGRIYGLTMYDISDYPKWQNVFRKEKTDLFKWFEGFTDGTQKVGFNKNYSYYYTVGTNDQYGNSTGRYEKYTFPLINGSHPKYNNLGVLKTGYAVRFLLDTTGQMYSNACSIKITPTFYYVDAKGENRQPVDLYYDEEVNGVIHDLVKVGYGFDLVNIQSGNPGNINSRIPEKEIKNTAAVMGVKYSSIANQISPMYSYSMFKILPAFRTFIGTDYASTITNLDSYVNVKSYNSSLSKLSLSKYMQRWYGTYKLPTDVHAVPSGYDVRDYLKKHGIDYRESFWLKNGYIIVRFSIVTIDDNGKQRLSYINGVNYMKNGNCSMWVMEGSPLQKTDYKGNKFEIKAGDFLYYFTDHKATEDYEGGLY